MARTYDGEVLVISFGNRNAARDPPTHSSTPVLSGFMGIGAMVWPNVQTYYTARGA